MSNVPSSPPFTALKIHGVLATNNIWHQHCQVQHPRPLNSVELQVSTGFIITLLVLQEHYWLQLHLQNPYSTFLYSFQTELSGCCKLHGSWKLQSFNNSNELSPGAAGCRDVNLQRWLRFPSLNVNVYIDTIQPIPLLITWASLILSHILCQIWIKFKFVSLLYNNRRSR